MLSSFTGFKSHSFISVYFFFDFFQRCDTCTILLAFSTDFFTFYLQSTLFSCAWCVCVCFPRVSSLALPIPPFAMCLYSCNVLFSISQNEGNIPLNLGLGGCSFTTKSFINPLGIWIPLRVCFKLLYCLTVA